MEQDKLRKLSAVQDHSRIYGKMKYVYPVISRRSGGLSIGVNLNPNKLCNYDCIYCEVDRHNQPMKAEPRVDIPLLREELEIILHASLDGKLAQDPKFADTGDVTRQIKDIAFSGDGEPTLVANLGQAMDVVADVKEELGLKDTKVVLITNATPRPEDFYEYTLQRYVNRGGTIWAKLDAGTEEYHRKINRSNVPLSAIKGTIGCMSNRFPVCIQSMFLKLNGEMISDTELDAYSNIIGDMRGMGAKIYTIHAYTVARPVMAPGGEIVTPLNMEELQSIRKKILEYFSANIQCFD